VNIWVGLHSIVVRRDKLAWLDVGGAVRPFSVDKLRVYEPPQVARSVPPAAGGIPPGSTQPADQEKPPAVGGTRTRGPAGAGGRGESTPGAAPVATEPGFTSSTTEACQRTEAGAQRQAGLNGAAHAPTPQSPPVKVAASSTAEPQGLATLLDAVISGEQYLVSVGAACRAMTRKVPSARLGNEAQDV